MIWTKDIGGDLYATANNFRFTIARIEVPRVSFALYARRLERGKWVEIYTTLVPTTLKACKAKAEQILADDRAAQAA